MGYGQGASHPTKHTTMTTFAVGDIVYLNSGSPALTVECVRADDMVDVKWYDGLRFERATFPPECLKRAQTDHG
jgi:uncharacterized protein YodC (DUF2158 family)